ncbi:hypothetical protein L1887_43447 [Cichorium endivia]|nr:hypothetical protein L1887_43447 [Cichorium endivia]
MALVSMRDFRIRSRLRFAGILLKHVRPWHNLVIVVRDHTAASMARSRKKSADCCASRCDPLARVSIAFSTLPPSNQKDAPRPLSSLCPSVHLIQRPPKFSLLAERTERRAEDNRVGRSWSDAPANGEDYTIFTLFEDAHHDTSQTLTSVSRGSGASTDS